MMDIAKYIATAVILSTVFSDVAESWIVYMMGAVAMLTSLTIGLWLIRDPRKKEEGGNQDGSNSDV